MSSLTLPDDALPRLADLQKTSEVSLPEALQLFDKRSDCVSFIGVTLPDLNLPGNVLVVAHERAFHSFREEHIVDEEILDGRKERVWVKKGTHAWRSCTIAIGSPVRWRETLVGMEDLPEPPTIDVPGMPSQATDAHRADLRTRDLPSRTITG